VSQKASSAVIITWKASALSTTSLFFNFYPKANLLKNVLQYFFENSLHQQFLLIWLVFHVCYLFGALTNRFRCRRRHGPGRSWWFGGFPSHGRSADCPRDAGSWKYKSDIISSSLFLFLYPKQVNQKYFMKVLVKHVKWWHCNKMSVGLGSMHFMKYFTFALAPHLHLI